MRASTMDSTSTKQSTLRLPIGNRSVKLAWRSYKNFAVSLAFHTMSSSSQLQPQILRSKPQNGSHRLWSECVTAKTSRKKTSSPSIAQLSITRAVCSTAESSQKGPNASYLSLLTTVTCRKTTTNAHIAKHSRISRSSDASILTRSAV